MESLAEPGSKRQQFRGVFAVSPHEEELETLEAPQGSRGRSCPVSLSVDLGKTSSIPSLLLSIFNVSRHLFTVLFGAFHILKMCLTRFGGQGCVRKAALLVCVH